MFKRLLFSLLLFCTVSGVFASHFRYGLVTATRLSETSTTVTYRLNVSEAWRLGVAPGSSYFQISGGNSGSVNVPMTTVTDPSGGWSNNTGTATVTLNKTATPTRIEYGSCCKIFGTNNSSQNWDEYIIINTNAPGSSPVSTLPAIINMPVNAAAATYAIPASDPDPGSTLTYGLPNLTSGYLNGQTVPSGFSINSITGQITLNTIGKSVGELYNAMVTVTDNDGNQIMLDFLINIVGFSNPPVFDYTVTPSNGFVYNVIAGQNISFPIKATDPDAGSSVNLSVSGLPSYITTSNFSPAFPATGNPSQTTFSWTPGAAEIGTTNILNIIATDNVGVQSTTSVTVKVVAEPAPVFIGPTPGQGTLRQIVTGILHQDQIVAQSSLGSNVSIAFATVPSGVTLSPSVPTAGANPGQTTVNWTPTPADFGQHNFSFQAVISSLPTIFATRSYSLIVNTPPVFSSTPAVFSVNAGQPFSYNVVVADPDIPYGDVIAINGTTLPSWLTLTSTGNGTAVLSGTPVFANGGINHVNLEAEDTYSHGNPASVVQAFDINVITCIAPGIVCPANITVNADAGICGAVVNYTPASTTGTTPTVSYSVASGSSFAVGTTTVTITAVNDCGTASCSFDVTVKDAENPTITAPATVTVNNDAGKCGSASVVLGTPVTGDNCGVKSTTNDAPAFFPVGNTTVTWTVTDIHGNIATAAQLVTVKDAENPTITAPATVSANNDAGKCGSASVVLGTPVTGDNCGVSATTNDAPAFFPVGNTTVTWTVTDTHGNKATAQQTVTVTDNEHPTVITKNITVTLLPDGKVSIDAIMVDGGSTDNCAVLSTSVTPSAFYCANIGSNEVVLTVTDTHGNSFSGKAIVTVLGEIPSCSIASIPTSTVFTGGNPLKLYLGYGAQSTTLKVTPAANGAPYTYSWSGPAGLNSTTSDAPVFTPTAAGQYTFTVTTTNKYGCTTSCSITICVSDIRVAGTNGSKVYVCHLPPGNTGNPQTLSISVNAVPAHLSNHTGDRLGSCDMAPCGTVVPAKSSVNNSTLSVSKEATDATEEALKVTVMPNPSNNYFTLKLVSKQDLPVSLKVLDANGRIIDVKSNIPANSTIQVGQTYISGTYYAEMIQGTQRKVVQLIKVK